MWRFSPGAILVFVLAILTIQCVSLMLARRETLEETRLIFDPRLVRLAFRKWSHKSLVVVAIALAAFIPCGIYWFGIPSFSMLLVVVFFPAVMLLLVRIAYLSLFDVRSNRGMPDRLDDEIDD